MLAKPSNPYPRAYWEYVIQPGETRQDALERATREAKAARESIPEITELRDCWKVRLDYGKRESPMTRFGKRSYRRWKAECDTRDVEPSGMYERWVDAAAARSANAIDQCRNAQPGKHLRFSIDPGSSKQS